MIYNDICKKCNICNKIAKIINYLFCGLCKSCIFTYQLTTKPNTMKKETAQLLAVFLVACYLIGQLQDVYAK